jgi:hypothetical protein
VVYSLLLDELGSVVFNYEETSDEDEGGKDGLKMIPNLRDILCPYDTTDGKRTAAFNIFFLLFIYNLRLVGTLIL